MSIATITYPGSSLYALPASYGTIATYVLTRRSASLVEANLFVVDCDAVLSMFWFLFDGGSNPTTWDDNIGVVDLTDYGGSTNLTYYFTAPTGSTLDVFPRALYPIADSWSDVKIAATEIDTGLFSVSLNRMYPIWDVFDTASVPTDRDDWIAQIFTGSSGNQSTYGSIGGRLSVDFEDEWKFLEGIEDVGLRFDAQRVTSLVAPASGIKAKRASPHRDEIIMAQATYGYERTDCAFVVWAQTLMSGNHGMTPVEPFAGDFLLASDCAWRVLSVKINMDNGQYRCYCRRTVLS